MNSSTPSSDPFDDFEKHDNIDSKNFFQSDFAATTSKVSTNSKDSDFDSFDSEFAASPVVLNKHSSTFISQKQSNADSFEQFFQANSVTTGKVIPSPLVKVKSTTTKSVEPNSSSIK